MGTVIKNSEELDALWKEYNKHNSQELKDKIIVGYSPLVKYIAGRVNMYLCNNVEFDDLVGYGVFGLIDAVNKFQLTKNVKFETYASLRIRGAILDSVRKMDWIPRSLRQKQKKVDNVMSELENELGREPTDEELAAKLEINIDELQDMITETNISAMVSLEDYTEQNYESNIEEFDIKQTKQPEFELEQKELKDMMKNALKSLSEREQKIIYLYYFEELTLKEISKILEISESRISQIHSKAIVRLRSKLGEFKYLINE